ncbi:MULTISPECIES: hypothetical protein [unclassified Streptomyces]|uniref:hypothetical protein n=1 Tax=unclassified Streptomyces TaxID=2593676 RepID=UPI0037FC508D
MTARLTSTEILAELRDALGKGGWLSTYTEGSGPGPLPQNATLRAVGEALGEHARVAPSTAVATQLNRAAQALTNAKQVDEGSATYEMLGTALAYVVQARRASGTSM